VLGGRAEEKLHLHDKQGALADFDAAINMDPTYYFLHSGRATLRFELKDYAGAIADCNKALPLCTIATDTYLCRGAAYAASDKLQEARSDYSKAIQLHPNDLSVYEKRAFVNFKMGALADGVCDFIHSRADYIPGLPAALLVVLFIEIIDFTPAIIEVKSCMR
jgi:tetratricopeptide (TPR) repeat protein